LSGLAYPEGGWRGKICQKNYSTARIILLLDLSLHYPMPIPTLTTDFGLKDGFVGTMKGVILGICPGVQLVDLTHTITPQNILEGAFALWRAYSFFPPSSLSERADKAIWMINFKYE